MIPKELTLQILINEIEVNKHLIDETLLNLRRAQDDSTQEQTAKLQFEALSNLTKAITLFEKTIKDLRNSILEKIIK